MKKFWVLFVFIALFVVFIFLISDYVNLRNAKSIQKDVSVESDIVMHSENEGLLKGFKGLKKTVVKDGVEYTLVLDKTSYKLGETVTAASYAKLIEGETRHFSFPDTSYYVSDVYFSSDLFELYKGRKHNYAVKNISTVFVEFSMELNDVNNQYFFDSSALEYDKKGKINSLKKYKDYHVSAFFLDIDDSVEIFIDIPFED